jgi:radical SAM superfamily enzyme YgiQ (UPF0313 family)
VRVRRPENVIHEMLELRARFGARVFLFQDDDFPLWGRAGRRWVDELTARMHETGLAEEAIWKISCRAEYVEPELFAQLRDAGLFLVYMGIESGVDDGLEVLHKQMTVEQNRRGVQLLKEAGLTFLYGFMLLDPSSTFDSIRENVAFLREIVGDGSAAATFCRMLPYGGTPIRDQLEREGRLRGDIRHPDYDFLDRRLNVYYELLKRVAGLWVHKQGLSHELNWAREEMTAVHRLAPQSVGFDDYSAALKALTAESNERLFELVLDSAERFEHGERTPFDPPAARHDVARLHSRLLQLRNDFVSHNVDVIVDARRRSNMRGPIGAPQVH